MMMIVVSGAFDSGVLFVDGNARRRHTDGELGRAPWSSGGDVVGCGCHFFFKGSDECFEVVIMNGDLKPYCADFMVGWWRAVW